MNEIEFVPDDWLHIIADSEEKARAFVGAPKGWLVKFSHFDKRGKVYKVLAVGLVIK